MVVYKDVCSKKSDQREYCFALPFDALTSVHRSLIYQTQERLYVDVCNLMSVFSLSQCH